MPPASNAVERIMRAIGVQLVARLLGTLASIVGTKLVTSYLGVNDYGLLVAAVAFVGLWNSLAELGTEGIIVRKVTSEGADLEHLVRTNVGLSVTYSLPLFGLCIGAGWLTYHGQSRLPLMIVIIGIGLIVQTLTTCTYPVFLTTVRFNAVALADFCSRVTMMLGSILVIHLHGGLLWIAVVQLLPPVIQLVIAAVAASKHVSLRPRFHVRDSVDLVRESLPMLAVAIIAVLYWRVDALLLSLLDSHAQVAAYGLAYAVGFNLSVIPALFLSASLSTMTQSYTHDRPRFRRFMDQSLDGLYFLGAPILLFGALLARRVLALLAGHQFIGIAADPLRVLLIAVVLTFLSGVLGQALFAAHDQNFLMWLNLANLALNIAANLLLIPHLHAVGASIALCMSEFSGVVVAAWRLRSKAGFSSRLGFILRLAPALAFGTLAWWATRQWPVLLSVLLIFVAYLGANLVLGPVRSGTIKALVRPPKQLESTTL